MKNKVLRPLVFLSWREFENHDHEPDDYDLAVVANRLAWNYDFEIDNDYI